MMEEVREALKGTDSIVDILVTMSEGNPGAVRVLAEVANKDFMLVLLLDDMNIRGTQIWVGFKDYCNEDMSRFMECVRSRDKGLVECINKVGLRGNHPWKAVSHGASFQKTRPVLP